MVRRPNDSRLPGRAYYVLYALLFAAAAVLAAYATTRILMTFRAEGYSVADRVMALALLGAELFVGMHALGYFFNIFKAGRRHATLQPIVFSRHTNESVAVLVCAFNEAESVLEETLASVRTMDYPTSLYLLDDSTNAECLEGARRVAVKYGARFVHRTNRTGYKAGAINDFIPHLTEKYIALLDADQKPREDWLKEVVAYMEDQPGLALVQSPQHYVNDEGLPVCRAAKFQQAVFFEYICEGKSYSNAMFCCGSNCVIRREALLSIAAVVDGRTHYFDERSVTEDFATSFRLHLKGWKTDYVNEMYVVGMGPETLPAYFTQQMRWAMGTMWQIRHIIKRFFVSPRDLTPAQWWEYWMVGTYFFIGTPHFIFMLAPVSFVLFGIKPLQSDPGLYLVLFVLYMLFSVTLLFVGLKMRDYSPKGVWLASALSFATFWIYMKAAMVALFGLKRGFAVTPKNVGGAIPLRRLSVEMVMLIANIATAMWCGYQVVVEQQGFAYLINGVWATYHAILLAPLFVYFNRSVTVESRRPLFDLAELAA
jgi:cellulose synthase/poly-beta-1,6-N-acetylglucosamine synthase-like glycosyltransferase